MRKEQQMSKIPSDKENMNKKIHMDYVLECARNSYGLRSHGFLYRVTNGFTANLLNGLYIKDGEIMKENFNENDYIAYKTKYIQKNSIIEFRYECNAHCRDIGTDYWVIDVSVLALCCEPFAKIQTATRSQNKLNLKEILENELYEKIIEDIL